MNFRSIFIVLFQCVSLFSIAKAQEIMNTPLVVIDAGHGGKDNGTTGANSLEKDITLAIAKKLNQKISSDVNINALLTRNSDIFLKLNDRSALANTSQADLFISLHCNHIHLEYVKGTELYVMGVDTDEEHLEIVKRENHTHEEENTLEDNDADHIMQSIFQTSYLAESVKLGQYMESEFTTGTTLIQRGIRQAEFRVLKNTMMPGVLIEMAYLSNTQDEKYVLSEKGQEEIAESIYQAISKYFSQEYVSIR